MGVGFYIIIGIIALITIVSVIGFLLPKKVRIERSRVINAEPDILFDEIGHFENFVSWSPWSEKDPKMTQKFEGEKLTVGSKYSWKGNRQVGEGYMEILELEPHKQIVMDLNFGPRGNSMCTFKLEPVDGGTKVSWILDSDLGNNPTARIFGAMMEKFVGKDFIEGLEKLAKKTERK